MAPLRPIAPSLRRQRPCAVVLGDLLLDVVVTPAAPQAPGGEVAGRVGLAQGGSAATTARWLARLGVRTTLVTSVGRDAVGRALVESLRDQGVDVHAVRRAGERTGRTAILRLPGGERSLVADRGAADGLSVEHLRDDWFREAELVHLPGYALVSGVLAEASRLAASRAHDLHAMVSLDLPSSEAVVYRGHKRAVALIRELRPDVLLGTLDEVRALLPGRTIDGLLELAPTVVVKRGANGATALALHGETRLRLEVATEATPSGDPTGAGDAFDAGFLSAWLTATRRDGRTVALQKAVASGHRLAARHLATPRPELRLG